MKNETLQLQIPQNGEGKKKHREGKLACACAKIREKTGDQSLVCKCYDKNPKLALNKEKDSKGLKNQKAKAI